MKTLVFDTNPLVYKGQRMKKSSVAGADHFFESFIQCVRRTQPDRIICLIDPPGLSWRAQVFTDYKLHRKRDKSQLQLRELVRQQLDIIKGILACLPVAVCIHNGYEADDIAYWLTKHLTGKILLVTIDRDWLQLCSKDVSVYLFDKNETVNRTNFTELDVPQKPQGVRFEQYLLYKAIVGDTSDGLKGISGIGPVKARQYLRGLNMRDDEWEIVQRNLLLMDLSKTPYTPDVEWSIKNQLIPNKYNREILAQLLRHGLLRHRSGLTQIAENLLRNN